MGECAEILSTIGTVHTIKRNGRKTVEFLILHVRNEGSNYYTSSELGESCKKNMTKASPAVKSIYPMKISMKILLFSLLREYSLFVGLVSMPDTRPRRPLSAIFHARFVDFECQPLSLTDSATFLSTHFE